MHLFLIYLLFAFPLSSFAKQAVFDKPQSQSKISLGESQDAKGQVELQCWDFKTFAVVQINDPAIKGAKEISLRLSKVKSEICAQDFSGRVMKLSDLSGEYYFVGAKGGYLFFESADSFGDQLDFQIRSAVNGKKLFSSTRNDSEGFSLTSNKNNVVSVTFFKALKVSCPLAQEGPSCWQKILKENEIPTTVKLVEPDCESSFKSGKSPLDNRAMVSVPVRVQDLSKPRVTFLTGAPTCIPAP